MSGITTNDVEISMKKGTTWDTAVAVSSGIKLRASRFEVGGGFGELRSDNIGFSKKEESVKLGTSNFQVSMAADVEYTQAWEAIMTSVMGTEGTVTETTASQGDYARNIDLSDSIYGAAKNIWTMAYSIEDATEIIELPSVKFNQFSLTGRPNEKVQFSASGLASRVKTSGWTSTYANVTGNTDVASELAVFGGTNAYLRINTASGGALSGTDDKAIEAFTLTLNRPLRPQHVLQGASSAYITEPKDIDRIDGQLSITFGQISKSANDVLDWWNSQTALKAELFFDGSQIGTGVNRSIKIQLPKLVAMPTMPGGTGIPNNNSLMTPTISFRLLKASAAPTGMTGVTDLLRIVTINQRSTKWTA